jgi:L,D-transpeptidase ErfK/SrfK
MNRLSNILFSFLLLCPSLVLALTFPLSSKEDHLVGKIQTIQINSKDNYTSIGRKFDVGYYEIFEANPGVDPDDLYQGTILVIPTQYILPPKLGDSIVINLAEMRLYYSSSKLNKVFTYPIGIGMEDWQTPTGYFKVIEKIKHPKWFVPKSILKYRAEHHDEVPKVVPSGADNPLGQYALRLSNPEYLIHGTDNPLGVGQRSSAGCIRMYPEDIKELFSLIEKGTRVFITNEPYKVTKEDGRIYLEAHMPLHEQRIKMADDFSPVVNAVKDIAKQNANHINWQQVLQVANEHLGIPQEIKMTAEVSHPPIFAIQPAHLSTENWRSIALETFVDEKDSSPFQQVLESYSTIIH